MVKFYFDKSMFIAALIMISFGSIVGFGSLVESIIRFVRDDNKQAVAILFQSVSGFLLALVLIFLAIPKLSSYYLIGNSTVIIKRGTQKLTVGVDYYNYIYYGYYVEGIFAGKEKRIGFIVISHYKMTTVELSHINEVEDDKYLVRIRINKRTINKLGSALPERLNKQMLTVLNSTQA